MMNPAETVEARPYWSVMIPVYNPPAEYLTEALRSVVQQDPGADAMQIEVIDDCSPNGDVAATVKSVAGPRVSYAKTPKNLGLAGCWNTCIERARGTWVHILHQDDFVLPGFYQKLARTAQDHPELHLLATRSFFVDEESQISGASPRVRKLENGGTSAEDFFYTTPIQCPGVVVRRDFYARSGGFRTDLSYALDCEMWARAVSEGGGIVVADLLACYRKIEATESGRLIRSAEGLRDIERLNNLFAQRYTTFNKKKANRRVIDQAMKQANHFSEIGETTAAKANLDYWTRNAPLRLRLQRHVTNFAKLFCH